MMEFADARTRKEAMPAFGARASALDELLASDGSSPACAHCGLTVPTALVEPGTAEQFCCSGCRAVRATLLASGLADYYDLRARFDDAATREPARSSRRSYATFDREAFQREHVRATGDLARIDLLLEGVRCAACVWLVEKLPRFVPGVHAAELRLRDSRVSLTYDPERVQLSTIAARLDSIGYPVHPAHSEAGRELAKRAERRLLVELGVAAVCAGNAMLVAFALYSGASGDLEASHAALFRWTGLVLGWIAILWPGQRFLRGAYGALRTRTANLDLPISIALVAGGLAGAWNTVTARGDAYFDSLTVLVFLLLAGRYVQARQQRFASDAVDLTRALTPVGCRVVRGTDPQEELEEVTLAELVPGDLVEVRSGEPLPADGTVEAGASRIDRALLTGESEPVAVGVGDAVHAGSQNVGGTLRVRVTEVGAASRIGRLMGLVQEGLAEKPPIERFTDRIAGWFVGTLTVLALATFLYWLRAAGLGVAIDHTVALLIVACPCALGLATPLTLAVAVGRAARAGLLVKDAAVFERLARGGHLLLDKTGTITRGAPTLVEWVGDPTLRADVAALEAVSLHPIARALCGALEADARPGVRASDVQELLDGGIRGLVRGVELRVGSLEHLAHHGAAPAPGQGGTGAELAAAARRLEAAGCTVVGVARAGRCAAVLGLVDAPRDGAREALAALVARGFTPEILSGDVPGAVARVAREVGLGTAVARGLVEPEQKLARVRELDALGRPSVMVGDGVNDAAALAAAGVGIAVHGGAEASLAAADAYSSRPGLAPLVELVDLARRALTTIRQNLALSLVYNGVAVVCAMLGLVDPLVAAILMPVSSASVLGLALLSINGGRRPARAL
jgi:Cu2+-exporting ATPase